MVALFAGCEGSIFSSPPRAPGSSAPGSSAPGEPPPPGPLPVVPDPVVPQEPAAPVNPFACEASQAPAPLDARRLSRAELTNAVRDLLQRALGPADAAAMLTRLNLPGRLPAASVGSSYSTSDRNFSVLHANELFSLADALATELGSAANYTRFVTTYVSYAPGACTALSPSALSDACEDALLRNFLLRAWGRPAEESALNANDELAAFRREFALAATSREGVEAMVVKALLGPQFLFHLQTDLRPEQGEVYRLSSHAIARRLAFTFTQSLPSEALLSLAATEDLADDAAFGRAVTLVSAQLGGTVAQFSREWLHLDTLPSFTDATNPKAVLTRAGLTANDALRDAMRDETLELLSWVSQTDGTLTDVFTSDVSFARQPDLMRVYGQTAPAPATVSAQNAVRFRAGERSGLLTRAAMLMNGSHTENPIIRAIHIRRNLLCLSTPQPGELPPNSLAPPEPNGALTTRERYQAKTSSPTCQGCHTFINPMGFALSKYNALGAYQPLEPAFDAAWNNVGALPTDARVSLLPALNLDREVADGLELGEVVASTQSLKSCLTRNYFSFVNGLSELPTDMASCEMRRMYQALADGASLKSFFQSAVADSRFRRRTLRSAP